MNFTLELDPEDYREAFGTDADKEEIRAELQHRAANEVLIHLSDNDVPARYLGRNNVYDRKERLTRAEHLVQ